MGINHEEVRRQFDAAASGYGRSGFHARYAEQLVGLLPLASGFVVLDAACGSGFASLAAASAVAPNGRVVGVDLSPAMVEAARLAARHAGATNVSFEVGDAASLPDLADEAFDAVVCSSALIYLPAAQALSEWRRLLRPGGCVAFSTMRDDAPLAGMVFREIAERHGVHLANPNAIGTRARCEQLLASTGYERVRVVDGQVSADPVSPDGAWTSNLNAAVFADVRRLGEAELEAMRLEYLAELARKDLSQPHRVLFAIGFRD